MKLNLAFFTLLSTFSMSAFAGHQGDVSCSPNWAICLQSMASDVDHAIHYVDVIQIKTQSNEWLSMSVSSNDTSTAIIIDDKTGVVSSTSATPIVFGQITEPVGTDRFAMSRELGLTQGLTLNITSKPGDDVTQCNKTATGVVFEYATHHTISHQLQASQAGQTVTAFESIELVQPPFKVRKSFTACPN
jgi:hypothetical protein